MNASHKTHLLDWNGYEGGAPRRSAEEEIGEAQGACGVRVHQHPVIEVSWRRKTSAKYQTRGFVLRASGEHFVTLSFALLAISRTIRLLRGQRTL